MARGGHSTPNIGSSLSMAVAILICISNLNNANCIVNHFMVLGPGPAGYWLGIHSYIHF